MIANIFCILGGIAIILWLFSFLSFVLTVTDNEDDKEKR